jgi:hypothetical protein
MYIQWDDDNVLCILDQRTSASSLKEQFMSRHVASLWHSILIQSQPLFALTPVTCSLKLSNEKGVKNPRDPMLNAITGGTLVWNKNNNNNKDATDIWEKIVTKIHFIKFSVWIPLMARCIISDWKRDFCCLFRVYF